MNRSLVSYRVEMKAVGPVFIGSGKEISKKEYVFLNNKKAAILDIQKLYSGLKKRGKSGAFEEYLLYNNRNNLADWLRRQNIMLSDIRPFIRYSLDCENMVVERKNTLQVLACMKDAYGNPYVPGSSLKGMFRTIFLGAEVMDDPRKYQRMKENLKRNADVRAFRNAYLKRDISGIEGAAFRTLNRMGTKAGDAVNDVLQGVIFSDSEPLSVDDLILCQRVELHTDRTEKSLPILRECIKPGTTITYMITIDKHICKLTDKQIIQAVNDFGNNYYRSFGSSFKYMDRLRDNEVLLGGGCGFVSKTVIYPLFGKAEGVEVTQKILEMTTPRIHKHNKDKAYGASPHIMKCTWYQGKTVQMGVCRLEKIEVV